MTPDRIQYLSERARRFSHVPPAELTQLLDHVQALEKLANDAARALWDVRALLLQQQEAPAAVEFITDKLEELRRARAALDGVS